MSKLTVSEGFAITSNRLLNNEEISFKAKGLFAYIISKPEGWDFSAKAISSQSKEGYDSIREGLRELESAGYLVRSKYQNELGHWEIEYTVYHFPVLENTTQGIEKPVLPFPMQEIPVQENTPNISNKDLSNKDLSKKESIDRFAEFWELYGNKVGKKDVMRKWSKLKPETKELIIRDVPKYLQSLPDWQQPMNPQTYLNRESWLDERTTTKKPSDQKMNDINPRVQKKHQMTRY